MNKKKKAIILSLFMTTQLIITPFAESQYFGERDNYKRDIITKNLDIKVAPQNPNFVKKRSKRDLKEQDGFREAPFNFNTNYETLDYVPSFMHKVGAPSVLPRSFDLRDEGRVTPVRDQGPNGSCWAFATYASSESVLLPRMNMDFSEKHLRNTHGFDWGPDDGGNFYLSSAYLSRWSGPVDESLDPYDPYGFRSPKNLPTNMEFDKMYIIPNVRDDRDRDRLKRALMDYGASYTTINGNEAYTNFRTMGHYNPGRGNANHAVTIVGWDDNYSKNNFGITPPGDGAWIVKNSWGKGWGNKGGYYYVSYYDRHVARNNAIFFMKNKEENKSIWYYDPLGMTGSIGKGDTGYFSNVFGPAKENLEITEVGFFVPSNNASYEVYVNTDYNRNSGFNNRIKVAEGTFEYAGYYTVKIDPQKIPAGASFAPIVKLTTPGYNYPIAIEGRNYGFSSRAASLPGQSFISYDGRTWEDVTVKNSTYNVCLKAMTKPDNSNEETKVKVEDIKVESEFLNLKVGETKKINYTVLPENAKNKEVRIISVDENIVRVENDIVLRALRSGSSKITITSLDNEAVKKVVNVRVSEDKKIEKELVLTSEPKDKHLNGKDSLVLKNNVKDENGNNMRYVYLRANIKTPSGTIITASKSTDYYGNGDIEIPYYRLQEEGTYHVEVTARARNYSEKTVYYDIEIGTEEEKNKTLKLDLETKKSDYTMDERADIAIKVNDEDGSPLKNVALKIKVTGPNGFNTNLKKYTDYNGSSSLYIKPVTTMGEGTYRVEVRANLEGYLESSHEITLNFRNEKRSELNLEATTDRDIYYVGQRATYFAKLSDENNNPLTGASVKFLVRDKFGRIRENKILNTNWNGETKFTSRYPLIEGLYTVEVEAMTRGKNVSTNFTFEVQR